MDPLAARRPRSVAFALVALAAAGWSAAGFVQDERARGAAEAFAKRFTLDRRRPLEVAAMRLERSPDGAAAVAVDAALEDARGSGPPPEEEAQARALWLDAARSIGVELEASRLLLLDAAGRRPGAAQHRFLLGEVQYASDSRSGHKGDPLSWIEAFRLAGAAAPGLDPTFTELGNAYVESWPRLGREMRGQAPATWHRAFLDSGFVAKAFLPVGSLIGREEAAKLLPDQAAPLRAGFDALAHDGDVTGAASLRPRLDRALRADRELGLEKIAARRRAGDLEGARAACQDWLARSPAGEFDDPEGRRQTARLLELWPNDTNGPWRTDPRGELVRFFLNRREKDAPGEALLQATEALTAVPDTVQARVRLLAGDPSGAEDIRQKSPNSASFEWVSYLVEVARSRMRSGDVAAARAVMKSLSPAAAEGCDVLLVRRDVAKALGDDAELSVVEERLRWLRRDNLPAEAWSAAGSLSLCLDGDTGSRRQLRIAVEAKVPAIVAYGWNGGRGGWVIAPAGSSTVAVPAAATPGRQILSVWSEAGGAISLGAVTVVPGG